MRSPSAKAAASLSLAAVLLLLCHDATSLIVPEEIPTVLSLIYSNIPPIKKGTDSRLGVGFRLGEHADFQIIVELGPQKETDPIGNAVDSKRKRATTMVAALRGELGPWAQTVAKYQMEQKIKKVLEKYKVSSEKQSKTSANLNKKEENQNDTNDWLSKWSQGLGVDSDQLSRVEQVSSRKPLPHVNRIKVVSSQTSSDSQSRDSAQNDREILTKLFAGNANQTQS